jgi:hypothetical protein
MRKSIAWMGTTALLVAGFFVGAIPMKAAGNPDSEPVSKLLSEAKTMAFQLKEDSATMATFTRANVKRETHAAAITKIKEHFNALMSQKVQELKTASDTASPGNRQRD